jgi:hypothetical protein
MKDKSGENIGERRFAKAAAHCLVAGEYYKPNRFAVEALLLYAQRKCLTSVDMSQDLAIIFGTLIRLATAQGYHRDPDTFRSGLSVFEGEMRRRTWSLCMNLDLLVSFQLGLPSNVQYPTWNTRPPTNLMDIDFDEGTKALPLARPDSEPTELLFYIAKHNLIAVFEKIIRHTLSVSGDNISELEAIDQELQATISALPSIFQSRSMAQSITDSPSVIVTRLCVDFIYQKCICVLHRKYVTRQRKNSVQACYVSASNIVGRFVDVYKEFQPGGQLEAEQWFMSSITWHDFLLGCMALCLVLCSTMQSSAKTIGCLNVVDLAESLQLLAKAETICKEQSNRSKDTRKVRRLIIATVLRFNHENGERHAISEGLQSNGQSTESTISWETQSLAVGDEEWNWDESTMMAVDTDEWTYLDQFLNLTGGEYLTSSHSTGESAERST